MLFKPELLILVCSGAKTQTRRLIQPDDELVYGPEQQAILRVHNANGRVRYRVGSAYAVQPGRGKPGQGFIKLLAIRVEDVRDITEADAIAEGFTDSADFLTYWQLLHKISSKSRQPNRFDYQAYALTFKLES